MAVLIVSRLRDRGILAADVETSSHISVAGAEQFYFVEVDKRQAEQARDALADMGFEKALT